MKITMNWAITIILSEEEVIEKRLNEIVSYIISNNQIRHCLIFDIDATGYIGNQMTQRLNINKDPIVISNKELSTLISEEGQIFELDLILKNSFEYRIIIRDNYYLEIIGSGQRLPNTILGSYEDLDINLFL
jgi:hypothetical protein